MIDRWVGVTCNRCYATSEILETVTAARRAAADQGWSVALPGGVDLCPACQPALRLEVPPYSPVGGAVVGYPRARGGDPGAPGCLYPWLNLSPRPSTSGPCCDSLAPSR